MRRIKIEVHPLSVVLGIACAVAASFAASPAQSPITALAPNAHRIAIVGPVTIDGIYDPREAVVIRDGSPFTVPAGRLLVLTAMGGYGQDGGKVVMLKIDGNDEVTVVGRVEDLPQGLTAPAGSSVAVFDLGGSSGRAWGYLVDA